jgi:hypothetical protein
MPKEQDEIEDMDVDSSTASEDVAAEVSQEAEAAAAESSTATDETEVDTLSIVRDVVSGTQGEPAAAASSAEGEEAGDQEVEGQDSQEQAPDDYSDVPFHKHPRFKQLISERDSLRGDSVEYRKITTYLDQNGLTYQEAAEGLEVMALMKLDPEKAWAALEPRVKMLLEATGRVLPQDLAERVKAGELTKAVALELSQERARNKAIAARQKFEAEHGQRQQQTQAVQAVVTAAQAWEADRELKDPNFAAKRPRIMEKLAFLHATEGRPNSPDGVKAQLKKAYDAVNKEIGSQAAPAPAARPVPQKKPALRPVVGGQVAGNAQPAAGGPKSTMDVIKNVLSKKSA